MNLLDAFPASSPLQPTSEAKASVSEKPAETQTREMLVTNRNGIEARSASMIVRVAHKYPEVELAVEKDGKIEDVRSFPGIHFLTAGQNAKIKFYATGVRSGELLDQLEDLFKNKFD